MSRDIKYVGMDLHKEAVVIAALNSSGKLVMESIVETKANSILHGEHGLRTLRELGRSYQTLSQDLNRVMNRIKALYRGRNIPCGGTQVYAPRYREGWLQKIEHARVFRRGEVLYQQLDGLQGLRRTLRPELLAESRKHKAAKLLRQIPCIGPIRVARLIETMGYAQVFYHAAESQSRGQLHSGVSCLARQRGALAL
jgi:hypothetical protein